MKIGYNLFVFECFLSYIHYTLKAVFPLGITAFFQAFQAIKYKRLSLGDRGVQRRGATKKIARGRRDQTGAVLGKRELLTARTIRCELRDVVRTK